MKLFIDTANLAEIREMAWLVDGVTTNPSLVAVEKRPFRELIAEICTLVDGPVSAEVTALDADGMVAEARELAKIHKNVVVKVPMTLPGMKAVQRLAEEEIQTNATLIFSANQALLAAKCGATYVSPFVGRIDDVGGDGMELVSQILEVYEAYAFSDRGDRRERPASPARPPGRAPRSGHRHRALRGPEASVRSPADRRRDRAIPQGLEGGAPMKFARFEGTRDAYGATLAKLGHEDPRIVVLTADLAGSTKTSLFAKEHPSRFFNMGVAEADMMGVAAGFAMSGFRPFASTFAVFATGKAWEQVRQVIAYPKVPVRIVATHAGLTVGEDGASHQMLEDIALMRVLPHMTVIVPADAIEAAAVTRFAASHDEGPVYVRLSREKFPIVLDEGYAFELGKWPILAAGTDVSIVACGVMVSAALAGARAPGPRRNLRRGGERLVGQAARPGDDPRLREEDPRRRHRRGAPSGWRPGERGLRAPRRGAPHAGRARGDAGRVRAVGEGRRSPRPLRPRRARPRGRGEESPRPVRDVREDVALLEPSRPRLRPPRREAT